MLLLRAVGVPRLVVGSPQSRSRQTRDCAAQESPGDRVPATGASIKRSRAMTFFATFVSIAVIVGAAVAVLTAVVGFGCYRFLRDLFGKPPRQLDA